MRVSQQLVAQHKFCATHLILNLPQALAIICHVCLNKVVLRISTSLRLLQSSQISQQLGVQHNICAQHFKSEDQHNICARNSKQETECHQTATLALGIFLLLPCLFLQRQTDQARNRKQKAFARILLQLCGGHGRVAPKTRCTPHSPSLRLVLCAEPAKGLTPCCPQSDVRVCIAILGTLPCSTNVSQHTHLCDNSFLS
jgi:hypothetical protein